MATFSMLQYDIPKRSGFPNPSGRLRRLAIRTSLSVWIVRDDHTPHHLIADMVAAGCTVRVLPFAGEAAAQVLAACAEELAKEVARVRDGLCKSLQKSGDKLQDGKVGPRQCLAAQRAALKRAEKALADARAVERLFGIDAAVASGFAAVAALHAAALERAQAYVALAEEVAEIDPPLAAAARSDEVPAGVLADRLEDEGQDTEAARRTLSGVCTVLSAATGRELAAAGEKAEADYPDYDNPYPDGTLPALTYAQAWDALHSRTIAEMAG